MVELERSAQIMEFCWSINKRLVNGLDMGHEGKEESRLISKFLD